MKKRLIGLLLIAVMLISIAAGCASGSKSEHSRDTAPASRSSTAGGSAAKGGAYGENAAEAPAADDGGYDPADSLAGIGSLTGDISNPILDERKVIRSASLDIEVESFDKAFSNIETIITGIGFIQETNINTDRVYVDDEVNLVKSGTIVLRVDRTKFDAVLNKLRGVGEVYNYTTHGEDVTDQYYDVESRLRLLKLEQEKIEAYVAKLDDLDQIFKAESKLTEIRYQIESLTGKLNKLSSLVELSTITLYLYEKRPGRDPKPLTYGEKLLESLKNSLLEVVDFLGDLLLFIVAALPALVLLGLLVLIGVAIYKKVTKNRKPQAGGDTTASLPGKQTDTTAVKEPDVPRAEQTDKPEKK